MIVLDEAKIPTADLQHEMSLRRLHPMSAEFLHNRYFPYDKKLARAILMNKHVIFIGDSLTRAMYKDMLILLREGKMNTPEQLRSTNEESVHGDRQIDILPLEANRVFRQAREYQTNRHLIQFFFTSRAMRCDLEKTFLTLLKLDEKPDIVVMNSAIWDISRYHSYLDHGCRKLNEEMETIDDFLHRVSMVCRRMRLILAPRSMFIWVLMPVVGENEKDLNRGFLHTNRLPFNEIRMRLLEANMRAAQIVREAGFDVLDLSFHFRNPGLHQLRIRDGVHWNNIATHFMNQLLLGHIVKAKKIEKIVMKQWKRKVKDNMEIRDLNFDFAIHLLKSMNRGRHKNEMLQQKLRSKIITYFENAPIDSRYRIFHKQFNEAMVTLRMFHMYRRARDYYKVFMKTIPEAYMNRILDTEIPFAKECIDYLLKKIDEMRKENAHGVRLMIQKGRKRKRSEERAMYIQPAEESRSFNRMVVKAHRRAKVSRSNH